MEGGREDKCRGLHVRSCHNGDDISSCGEVEYHAEWEESLSIMIIWEQGLIELDKFG